MMDEFYRITKKAINFVFLIATPMMVYFMLFAKEGVFFLSGDAYAGAIIPMQVIMPTLLFIGLTNIMGIQMLVPLGKEKVVLYSEIAGMIGDIILNALLIPKMASTGAAIGTLAAEIAVFIVQYVALRGIIKEAYRQMIANLLDEIEVRLSTDYLENKAELDALADKVVYTGPIDAYFDYKLGTLEYRSVRFETETLDKSNGAEYKRRKLEYFAKQNRQAKEDIVEFLNNGVKTYLLEEENSTLECELGDNELGKLFLNGRYSFSQFPEYYDAEYNYATMVSVPLTSLYRFVLRSQDNDQVVPQ